MGSPRSLPMRPIAIVLVPALLLAACAPRPRTDAAKVAESFHAFLLMNPAGGAPSATRLEGLAPYLSDSLYHLLERADRVRDSEALASPGEKPSYADGDLFTSLFEGPNSFFVQSTIDGPHPKVVVRFDHDDGGGKHTIWTDTTVLVPHDTTWVVDDIIYGGTWPFAQKGTLREVLTH